MAEIKLKQGTVKRVLSGNTIVLLGPIGKDGFPLEKTLQIANVSAPRFSENSEDPVGFRAREYLRSRVIGRQVDFTTDVKAGNREVGRVLIGKDDLALAILNQGLGKVYVDNDNKFKVANFDALQNAEKAAKTAKKGVWADADALAKDIRNAASPDAATYPGAKVLELGKAPEGLKGVVESYYSGTFTVYTPATNTLVNLKLAFITTPILSQRHGQELRNFLETLVLNRDATIRVISGNEKNTEFVTTLNVGDTDVILELLKNGWGRLTQTALVEVEANRYKIYKSASEDAQSKKLRIWAEYKNTKSTSKEDGTSFDARIVEIHSGDSLSVESLSKGEVRRVFLANIRAPQVGNPKRGELDRPYAFESKDFVRKQAIGKKVRVEIEFSREIKTLDEGQENRKLTFASIWLPNEKNLAELIVESGWATVNLPRSAEEDVTKYLKVITDAEERARNAKAGIHATGDASVRRFNDLTQNKNPLKVKQFFEFLKDEKSMRGVVDLVLSGTRYKVRLDKHNCYIILNLHGVRSLPNDKNIPEYEHYSNLALKFSRDNVLQRDVEVEVDHCDNKGLLHGSVNINKRPFGANLIEAGLAQYYSVGKAAPRYYAVFQEAEEAAKKAKLGIWSGKVNLSALGGGSSRSTEDWKVININQSVIVSEITDASEFYIQDPKSKALEQIEKELDEVDEEKTPKLEAPIKRGTPCLTIFSGDDRYYRARVNRQIGTQDKYNVTFFDFGNSEDKSGRSLRKLPKSLLDIEPQAKNCKLAYIKVPDSQHEAGEDAANFFRDLVWEKKLNAQLVFLNDQTYYAVISGIEKTSPAKSVNAQLIEHGYARIDRSQKIPEDVAKIYAELEEAARTKALGLWKYDDVLSDNEYE